MKALDDAPLVHDSALFDSRSWLHITNEVGWPDYRPLVHELEEAPRNNAKEREPGVTIPFLVLVYVPKKGRTGKRAPVQVYLSQSKATQEHGRKVRTSIESGTTVEGIRARKIDGATKTGQH